MKKNVLLLFSALIVMALASSCSDELKGDQGELKGKSGVLSMQLKSSGFKTKAEWTNSDTPENEKGIQNFTIFVFKTGGAKDAVFYSNSFTDGMTVDIPVSADADSVMVVANMGDEIQNTITTRADLFSETLDLSGAPTYLTVGGNPMPYLAAGSLIQTGGSKITWTSGTPSAVVNLKFINSRISFEKVTLFGLGLSPDSVPSDPSLVTLADTSLMRDEYKEKFKSLKISEIGITSVFILNAPSTSYLFPRTVDTWSEALFTGSSSFCAGFEAGATGYEIPGNGQYHPTETVAPADTFITYMTSTYLDKSLGNSAIPYGTDEYPYFYVWENRDNGILTSGITLAVIMCDVKYITGYDTNGDPILSASEHRYYTTVLNNTVNNQTSSGGNTYPNYSTKRGVHYRITANIAGVGKADPYSPNTLSIQLFQTSWDDMLINSNF